MEFDVQDFHDLIRLLEAHPEWRAELRRLVLTEELLELPHLFRELVAQVARLAEAQARLEERVGRLEEAVTALTQAQARTEERLAELALAQARTEERVGRLEEAMARLAEAQARLEERVGRLEERVGHLEEAVEKLRQEVGQLANTVGATAEEEAVSVLLAVLRDKGFELLTEPTSVTVDGREVDLVAPVKGATGEVLWALVDVKFRLSPGHIHDWAQRISSADFRRRLREAGVPGPYLAYSYGMRVFLGAPDAARTLGVGLLSPRGELVSPRAPIEPAA